MYLKPSTWNLVPGSTISRLRGSKTGVLGRRMVKMSVASLSRYLIQDTWNNKSTLHLKPRTWSLLPGATISRLRGSKTGALGRRMVEMSVASPPPRLRSHDRRIGQHTDGIAHNSDGIAHSTDGITVAHNSAAFSSHFGRARIFIHTALCRCQLLWNCNDEHLFGKHCKMFYCHTVQHY